MQKFALFVFNGDPLCFIHVLLNALDIKAKGHEAKIILEGASVKLISELVQPGNPLNGLWKKNLVAGLVAGIRHPLRHLGSENRQEGKFPYSGLFFGCCDR